MFCLLLEKIFRIDTGLFQNSTQRALWHVAGMVGDGCKSTTVRIMPDFMTPCCMTIKLKAECFEFSNYLPVFETRQPSHSTLPPNNNWQVDTLLHLG